MYIILLKKKILDSPLNTLRTNLFTSIVSFNLHHVYVYTI